jgi:hypothetical protein
MWFNGDSQRNSAFVLWEQFNFSKCAGIVAVVVACEDLACVTVTNVIEISDQKAGIRSRVPANPLSVHRSYFNGLFALDVPRCTLLLPALTDRHRKSLEHRIAILEARGVWQWRKAHEQRPRKNLRGWPILRLSPGLPHTPCSQEIWCFALVLSLGWAVTSIADTISAAHIAAGTGPSGHVGHE